LNVTGIIYPQYWLQTNHEQTFLGHLALLKAQYCHPQLTGDGGVMCLALLAGWKLDRQVFFVVVIMISNCNSTILPPFNYNPTS